ncbi:RNA exonuclease 1-like protein [Acropora cervicornis]|uniref:RNA exonuclease 1-like protein n=1 Tax=Acropora cervicornis TaxID=6130 RepID=A0AAD9VCV3_ACRCE|nr:RNA exonuclease 1-like protein [Acropora cervicornis]
MNNAKPSPSSLHNSKPLKKKDIARKAKNKAKADRRIRRNPVEVKSPQPVKNIKDNSKPLRKNDIAREAKNETKVDKRIRRNPVEVESPQPVEKIVEEEVMYDFLLKYLMTEDDLVQNGFPRPCPSMAGKAVMKMKKEQSSRDPSRRICQRCGKPFVVLEDGVYQTKEECVYHAGKLFGKKGQQIRSYSCCQGDAGSPGCCVGQVHVSDEMHDTEGFMTTICYTTRGLELTRITVVNWNLEVVYDTFSGVTAELLRGVTTTIREVQAVLLSMIHKDTILVGHSLESDLKATKRALRNLMADHLKKIIQDSVEGHDSFEDAKACLELMRWKVKEDMKKTTRHKTPRLSVG